MREEERDIQIDPRGENVSPLKVTEHRSFVQTTETTYAQVSWEAVSCG